MYVAITRARQRLYLSFGQTRLLHGQTRYNLKSRFLDELPEEALKWLTPRQQGFGSGYAREYQQAWARGSGLSGIVGAGRVQPLAPAGRASGNPAGRASGSSAGAAAGASAAQRTHGGLRVGQSVFHAKFGEGVLLTLEGAGDEARAQVNFGRHGLKWLALSVAKLTPIE